MANSADPDQLASGSALYGKVGYIRVQQDTQLQKPLSPKDIHIIKYLLIFSLYNCSKKKCR